MTPTTPPPLDSAEAVRQRVARAEEIKKKWDDGQSPDAVTALRDNPELAADSAIALDLAYEEFCKREEAGERLDSVAFCAKFQFGVSLRRLITVHRFLSSNPEILRNSTPTVWPGIGDRVADFQLKRELGRGGFARVYLASEASAGARPVALKVSAAASREADTLGPLSHPNLITVYSSRPVGDWNVVAMPFAGTATLEDAFAAAWGGKSQEEPRTAEMLLQAARRKTLADDPPCTAAPAIPLDASMTYADGLLAIARGLLSALVYLHEQGFAHRDLKPSNVLLSPSCHPYLLDFNLASHISDVWAIAGTLPYLAPEQLTVLVEASSTTTPADSRPGDVFAFGVMMFELFNGRHPFVKEIASLGDTQAEAAATLLTAQRKESPSPNALLAALPPAVCDGIMRCLALDPAARPTAAELEQLLRPAAPVEPPATRHRWRWVFITTVVLSVAIGGPLFFSQFKQPQKDPQENTQKEPPPPPQGNTLEVGKQLFSQGESRLAASEFMRVGRTYDNGQAYACAAYILSLVSEPDLAILAAENAIRLGFETAPVYANRAWNHVQKSRLVEAKADCEKALKLDPNLHAARLTRANIYLRLQLKDGVLAPEAITDIQRVLKEEPNTDEEWFLAAQIYVLAANGSDETMLKNAEDAVKNAILAGRDPALIQRSQLLKSSALAKRPAYQEALKLKPGPHQPKTNPYLANVIP